MKILLSPAKSLNESATYSHINPTAISFPEETGRLAKKMENLSAKQIKKLMHVSDDLADLNYNRFQSFSNEFNTENSIPAGFIFNGAAYLGLDFETLSAEEQEEAQMRLRILSGLYGVLKPFDLIQPYRLEMGTSLKVTPKVTNLYQFWGTKIQTAIEKELKEEGSNLLVNVASSEYFKAAKLDKMKGVQVITPAFKDINKNGEYKVNMTFAKRARGLMARYIIQHKLNDAESLKSFNAEGYYFAPKESDSSQFVFLRDKK